MATWIFIVAATAFGGAVVLWHAVSKAKHLSEGMLDEYARMLAAARQKKSKELVGQGSAGGGQPDPPPSSG
jgi:hypothetical protein